MASIDNVLVGDVEKAFGLNAGDIKLIDSPECAPLLKQNAWTKCERTLGVMDRFETVRRSLFNTTYGRLVVALGSPIIDFPDPTHYLENVVYGIFRLYNLFATYDVVAYVNENVRLLNGLMPWEAKNAKVEKMTDLVMVTFAKDEELKEGEYAGWYLEGPSSEEYIGKWANIGKTFVSLKKIDLEEAAHGGCCTPAWLKKRAQELLGEEDKKIN